MMNFTIGKYYNRDSVIHRLDPRCKLWLLLVYIVSCFMDRNVYLYVMLVSILGIYICISELPLKLILRTIKPVIVFALVLAVINIFTTAGIVVWEWGFFAITKEGVYKTVYVFIRWILIVVACGMFTYTTKPTDITRGLEKGVKLSSSIAMMVTIAIRFLPIMAEELRRIKLAQEIRGANFKKGNVFKRCKLYINLMGPLMQNSMDRASNLSMAMDARCYASEKKRSSLHPLKYKGIDFIFYGLMIVYMASVIGLAIYM